MKKNLLFLICLSTATIASAQIQYSSDNTEPNSKIENLSGPRLGITIITNGTITETLNDEFNISSNVISQFGYQFEKQIAGDDKIAGLIGSGIRLSFSDAPVVSISLNSPGCSGSSSSRIRMPRALNPAGRLAKVPASISCRSIDVAALDIPPIMWLRPKP